MRLKQTEKKDDQMVLLREVEREPNSDKEESTRTSKNRLKVIFIVRPMLLV